MSHNINPKNFSTPKNGADISSYSYSKISPINIDSLQRKLSISSPSMLDDPSGLDTNYQTSSRSINQFSVKIAETDANTIYRQRKELQLLINELKDRDRELNEIVHSHHNELVSWQADRKRISGLEKLLSRTKIELKKRHEKCKILRERLQLSQSGVQSKSIELENTQFHLHQISEKANVSSTHVEELKAKNEKLEHSVKDLSNQISSIRSREQEMSTLLRLKEKDLNDANNRVNELSEKLQSATKCLHDYRNIDSNMKVEVEKLRSENLNQKQELVKLKSAPVSPVSRDATPEDISAMKQTILHLQKEVLFAGEREKRKDSLLELSKSRQERTEAELTHVRQLYKSLQEDVVLMKEKVTPIEDDRLSILSASDFDENEMCSLLSENFPQSFDHSYHGSDIKKSSFSPRYNHTLLGTGGNKKQASTLPSKNPNANFSYVSLPHEDNGIMTSGELKSQEYLSDISKTINISYSTESISSPTSRLQRLLEESRKMVLNLEKSPPVDRNRSTPVPVKDEGSVEEF